MEKCLKALPVLTAVSEQTKAMAHLDADDTKHHKDSQGAKEAKVDWRHWLQQEEHKAKEVNVHGIQSQKVYEEESAVVWNLYFVQDLEEERKVEVFGHEWTSCPASLFEPDLSLDQSYAMRKENKADYLAAMKTALASSWGEVDKLSPSDKPVVMVVDAMAFIQRYQHFGSSTFHELQGKYLRQLLGILPDKCDCIHFVGDRYDVSPAESLKGKEREKRMKTCPSKMKEYKAHDTLPIPEWKGFIHNPLNKANLLNYMGEASDCQVELPEPTLAVLFAVSSGGEGEGLSTEQYLQCATLLIIPPHRDLHLVN
ncbi:unnamed protein product [Leuciscus chuanchicus]